MPTLSELSQKGAPALAYVCPHTHGPLKFGDCSIQSADGNRGYPLCNGIPQFLEYQTAETEETDRQLARLNKICVSSGWRVALEEVYGKDSNLYHYVTSTKRAAFLDLLPLRASSVVMELGAGLGQFTPFIARRAGFVYALEVVPGQAEFLAQRCLQQGVANVSVACGGDNCLLPYRTKSFDGIICNLVFEWCAMREQEESWLVHARLLREMARILKPGGFLYLATKNRFSLRYVLGGRDEHMQGLRFGSALPMWIRHMALRISGRARPQGILYSYGRLRKMLSRHGFELISSYWACPEFRHPERFIPTNPVAIRRVRRGGAFQQGSTKTTRLLMPLIPAELVKYLTPGLVFLVQKVAEKAKSNQKVAADI